jgi:hypothetical protein
MLDGTGSKQASKQRARNAQARQRQSPPLSTAGSMLIRTSISMKLLSLNQLTILSMNINQLLLLAINGAMF